ncbi:MAG: transposase [Gammaproteobacteria bacterium]|nr:transposase [Gammaproteobacteria bacterium]
MDTNSVDPVSRLPVPGRIRYQHHSLEFKRAVVEATYRPGALSVSRIARHHGINANQVFKWRRAFRDGTLGSVTPALLPVEIVHSTSVQPAGRARAASDGSLVVESSRGRLHIEGEPHVDTLRVVLEQLLR